jgi:ribonuclease R
MTAARNHNAGRSRNPGTPKHSASPDHRCAGTRRTLGNGARELSSGRKQTAAPGGSQTRNAQKPSSAPAEEEVELKQRILEYVGRSEYRPMQVRGLARALGIARHEYGRFHDVVRGMMKAGRLVIGYGDSVTLPAAMGRIEGVYRANPRGFGFVIPEDPGAHGDLFIPPGAALDAITGDVVRAEVVRKKKADGMLLEGRVVEVVQRGDNRFVGELVQEDGRHYVMPAGNSLHVPIFIGDVSAKGARPGDQVVVEMVQYPSATQPARGVILEVLGKTGDPGVDVRSIIWQHHLPEVMPPEAHEEARRAIQAFDPEAERGRREDLTGRTIVTIDPVDARDFDDAISLERRADGTWELGVHIADVSFFVREGGALDEEARKRGNSVYFPRHVIPMLPEILSNGVCSLQEGQPRLTKSVFIRYDKDGNVLSSRFANTIISSTRRLHYQQAQAIIDGKAEALRAVPQEVVRLLRDMDGLAKIIRRRRLNEGMLVLEMPEVELVLDDQNRVIDAVPADASFTHTIIEMFMVEANEAVARLFEGLGVPALRRIHEDPDDPDMKQLRQFLGIMGYKFAGTSNRKSIQKLLDQVRGKPQSYAVNIAVLRSMQKAEYSPRLVGHYALASRHYTHFTSPIRRYPDLVIHRLLDRFLAGQLKSKAQRKSVPGESELAALGKHCSYTERRAEAAERELKTVKVLELLSERVGETVEGVVTGVANFGVFVELRKFLIEGIVRFNELPDDWWQINQKAGAVVGQRSGRRIAIGNVVRARIIGVNIAARQLNLSMADEDTGGREARRQPKLRDHRKQGRRRRR